MKRFTGHMEAWGSFVDVKIYAPEILQRQWMKSSRGWKLGLQEKKCPSADFQISRQVEKVRMKGFKR
jgi:hypothetical protein